MRETRMAMVVSLAMLALVWAQELPSLQDQAKRELESSEARLREVYGQVLGQLEEEERERLAAVQGKWDGFREESAVLTAQLVSRSEEHTELLATYERLKLTRDRLATLQRILEARSPNGDDEP